MHGNYKEYKPKILHLHGMGGHMTHNGGMEPCNTKGKVNRIKQVTNQATCLKQSSGMISSHNTRKNELIKYHDILDPYLKSQSHVSIQTHEVSMR